MVKELKPKRRRIAHMIKLLPTLKYDGRGDEYDPKKAKGLFNMESYFHPCGSPSCIAGYVIAEFGNRSKRQIKSLMYREDGPWVIWSSEAAALLGLDEGWASDFLFAPIGVNRPFCEISNIMAAKALGNVLKAIRAGKDYRKLTIAQVWGNDNVINDFKVKG